MTTWYKILSIPLLPTKVRWQRWSKAGRQKYIVEADAKGKIPVIVTYANDMNLNVLISMLVAPGMGYHVQSVVEAPARGVVAYFEENKSNENVNTPLEH